MFKRGYVRIYVFTSNREELVPCEKSSLLPSVVECDSAGVHDTAYDKSSFVGTTVVVDDTAAVSSTRCQIELVRHVSRLLLVTEAAHVQQDGGGRQRVDDVGARRADGRRRDRCAMARQHGGTTRSQRAVAAESDDERDASSYGASRFAAYIDVESRSVSELLASSGASNEAVVPLLQTVQQFSKQNSQVWSEV
jgi:hypothetical protein